jgi:hypothetical protein
MIGVKVKETLTEVKMSGMRKRAGETDKKKTYQRTDRVTVLGLVCEKMSERVRLPRQEEEDRRVRQEVSRITQDESVDEENMVDPDGFPDDREILEVTHVCEEDLETTEREGVDFLDELLELVGWSQVNDEETEKDLS